MKDKLEKIIKLEDESNGILIVYVKPRNKNSVVIYDTDHAAFDLVDNKLLFYFLEYKSFEINLTNISNINVSKCDDNMTIAYILLKNGNTVMIHFMKD